MSEREQQMARLYVEEGLTYEQIAKRYKITRQRVGQILGPMDLAKHQGIRWRAERLAALHSAHARIAAGESTVDEEAAALGYAKGNYLRTELWRIGIPVKTPPKPEPEHGTIQRYKRGCHCDECRRANRDRARSLRGGEPPSHGESGYRNYGCHCQTCKEGARVADRNRRAQRRKKKEIAG